MDERLLTTREVSTRLHRHPKTVLRFIRTGKLKAKRTGPTGHYLIRESDLDSFLQPVESN